MVLLLGSCQGFEMPALSHTYKHCPSLLGITSGRLNGLNNRNFFFFFFNTKNILYWSVAD